MVTMGVQTTFTQGLSHAIEAIVQSDLLPVRVRVLHGEDLLGGRVWAVIDHEVITASRAKILFPHDPAKAGLEL